MQQLWAFLLQNPQLMAWAQQQVPGAAVRNSAESSDSLLKVADKPDKYDGKKTWDDYRPGIVRFLIGSRTRKADWGIVSMTYLKQGSMAEKHFDRFLLGAGKTIDQVQEEGLSWDQFEGIMRAGSFGVPRNDYTIREQLSKFMQQLPPNTADFFNKFMEIVSRAPNAIDDFTLIYWFLEACCDELRNRLAVPVEGGEWRSWEHFSAAVRDIAPAFDREHQHLTRRSKPSSSSGPAAAAAGGKFATKHVSFAAAAGKDQGRLDSDYGSGSYGPQRRQQPPKQRYSPAAFTGRGRSSEEKYGSKPSFNAGLTAEQVERYKKENRCFQCHQPAVTADGRFDRDHYKVCNKKAKRD